jgi:hypothetical protein
MIEQYLLNTNKNTIVFILQNFLGLMQVTGRSNARTGGRRRTEVDTRTGQSPAVAGEGEAQHT